MSTNKRCLYDTIQRIVDQETKYLRPYVGKVLSTEDDQNAGRVLAEIPGLGLTGQDKAAWCWPAEEHALSVPAVGEYVEVSFVEGNANYPRYRGVPAEVHGGVPKAYSGDPALHVLFQDPQTGDSILYDERTGRVSILGDGDNLVTYSALATAFQNMVNVFNAHTHPVPGVLLGGPGTVTSATLTPQSADISAAKAMHLRTNG